MGIFTNFRGAIGAMVLTGYGLSVRLFSETTVEECVANFKTAIEDFQTKNIVIKFYESTNTLRTEFDAQVTRNYPTHFFKAWEFGLHEMMKLITPEEANSNLRDLCQEKLEENKLSEQIANVCLVISAVIIVCILLPKVFSFVKKPVADQPKPPLPFSPRKTPRQRQVEISMQSAAPSFPFHAPSLAPVTTTNAEKLQAAPSFPSHTPSLAPVTTPNVEELHADLERQWNTAKNNARKHK